MKSTSRDYSQGSKSIITNTSSTALPLILLPKCNRQVSNRKLKDRIMYLKKKLNKTQYEFNELKISMVKLESQKRQNKKVLDNAINESKIVERPLDLIRSNSARELSISIDTYSNMKETNMIFNIKHEISVCQKKIREKNNQMRELNSDSKFVSLIEKNKELVGTIYKITTLNATLNDLKIVSLEKESKREDVILNRDYYKVLNGTMKNENESLKEKLKTIKNEIDISRKKRFGYEDKFNNLKLKYNILKKIERDVDIKIKYNANHTGSNTQVIQQAEDFNIEYDRNISSLQSIEEEVKVKNKKLEEMNKANEELKSQVENEKNSIKRYRLDENILIDGIKKDIVKRDKEILHLRCECNLALKDMNKFIKELQRKEEKRIQKIKMQISRYKVCKQLRLSYIRNNDHVEGEEYAMENQLSDNENQKDEKRKEENKDNKKKKKKDKEKDKRSTKNKDKDKDKEDIIKIKKDNNKDEKETI